MDANRNGGPGKSNNGGPEDNTFFESSSPGRIITKILRELESVEAGEHNMLTFQEMEILKEIRSRYCADLLVRRNMTVLLLLYVESKDDVIWHLRTIGGIDADKYIADGSLLIECDAPSVIASTDFDFRRYLLKTQDEARRKGKQGLGIILDISGLLVLDAIEELIKFESKISPKTQPHLEYASLLCCYNGFLFDKVERMHRETILNNHHRRLCGMAVAGP